MAKTKRCVCIINPKIQLMKDKLLHYLASLPHFQLLLQKKQLPLHAWSENGISVVWEIMAYHIFFNL